MRKYFIILAIVIIVASCDNTKIKLKRYDIPLRILDTCFVLKLGILEDSLEVDYTFEESSNVYYLKGENWDISYHKADSGFCPVVLEILIDENDFHNVRQKILNDLNKEFGCFTKTEQQTYNENTGIVHKKDTIFFYRWPVIDNYIFQTFFYKSEVGNHFCSISVSQ